MWYYEVDVLLKRGSSDKYGLLLNWNWPSEDYFLMLTCSWSAGEPMLKCFLCRWQLRHWAFLKDKKKLKMQSPHCLYDTLNGINMLTQNIAMGLFTKYTGSKKMGYTWFHSYSFPKNQTREKVASATEEHAWFPKPCIRHCFTFLLL